MQNSAKPHSFANRRSHANVRELRAGDGPGAISSAIAH
jgi:hypothetical protein